jgi:hypothetical protein
MKNKFIHHPWKKNLKYPQERNQAWIEKRKEDEAIDNDLLNYIFTYFWVVYNHHFKPMKNSSKYQLNN